MAHSNNSVITGKLKGMLGKELVFRDWDGKTVVAKAPKSRKGKPTATQVLIQENFLMGTKYAKAIVSGKNPELMEGYQANAKPRQNVYSRALQDFISIPKVTKINAGAYAGAVGDKIVVRATDDFRVVSVSVAIYSENGVLLESGQARLNANGLDWTYTATQENQQLAGSMIHAVAVDVPNNEGMLKLVL